MNYNQNVSDILKGILEGIDIGSDESYCQACQQIKVSSLLPWQKELWINQLTVQRKEQKNFIITGKFILDLNDLIFNASGRK